MNSPIPIVYKPTRCMFVSFRTRCARSAFVARIILFEVHGNTVAGRMSFPSGGDESASGVGAVLLHGTPLQPSQVALSEAVPSGHPCGATLPHPATPVQHQPNRATLRERCQA
jgi:hypothetical protein